MEGNLGNTTYDTGIGKGFLNRTICPRNLASDKLDFMKQKSWNRPEQLKNQSGNKKPTELETFLPAIHLIENQWSDYMKKQTKQKTKNVKKSNYRIKKGGAGTELRVLKRKKKMTKKKLKNCSSLENTNQKSLRFYLTPIRMASSAGGVWAKGNSAQYWRNCQLVVTLEVSVESPQKAKHKSTPWPRHTTPWHAPRGLAILLYRYLVSYVYCFSIHNS